jgi:hypothetical protein
VIDVGNKAVHGLPPKNEYMRLFADTCTMDAMRCHESF